MLNPTDKAILDEIVSKGPAVITEEEAAILRARRSYLSEEQKAVFAEALAATEAVEAEEKPKKAK